MGGFILAPPGEYDWMICVRPCVKLLWLLVTLSDDLDYSITSWGELWPAAIVCMPVFLVIITRDVNKASSVRAKATEPRPTTYTREARAKAMLLWPSQGCWAKANDIHTRGQGQGHATMAKPRLLSQGQWHTRARPGPRPCYYGQAKAAEPRPTTYTREARAKAMLLWPRPRPTA